MDTENEFAGLEVEVRSFDEKIPVLDWYVTGNMAGWIGETVQVIFPIVVA
jgi:uncharacterized membrane protein YedE/YeeE